jgi:hypothetical protein
MGKNNKLDINFDKKDKGGRPRIFKNPKELDDKIQKYFDWAVEKEKPLTVERLCVFMEISKQTLYNYLNEYSQEDKNKKFFDSIKKAVQIIEADKVERLNGRRGNPAGIIFDLKNNHHWKDTKELRHEGDMEININISGE